MNLSTPLLIHILVEVIVFVIVFLYFQKKINQVYAYIREIQKHMMNQQNLLNKHEKILSELIGVRPHIQTDNFDFVEPEQAAAPAAPPTSPVQPPGMMPMMESIFSMLNTVASVATPPAAPEPPVDAPPQEPKEKIDVESELEKELEELNETRPEEGRVEEEEKTI